MLGSADRVKDWFGDAASGDSPNQMLAFSDNIADGSPFYGPWYDGGLLTHVFGVAGVQLNLVAVDGTLLRGGIAQGPLHMNENVVVGAWLVAAYKLERDHHLPRVVLSQETVAGALAESLQYADPCESATNAVLLVDPADDEVFVNYLGTLLDGSPIASIRQALQAHRVTIRTGLAEAPDGGVRTKYVWTAGDHNWFCTWIGQRRYMIAGEGLVTEEINYLRLVDQFDLEIPEWRALMREEILRAKAH